MNQFITGLDPISISSSYDAPASGTSPVSQTSAYGVAGDATSAVSGTYRDVLSAILALTQDTNTDPVHQARNAIALVELMSQLRQSAATGSDYINGAGTDPFLMSEPMVQAMDKLSIQMAANNLTPAKIIAWAQAAGVNTGLPSNTIPTDFAGIKSALDAIFLATTASSLSISAPFNPNLTFAAWKTGMTTTDNTTLLLTQIQSTYPALSSPLDNGDGTGGATQVLYEGVRTEDSVIESYNSLIADINVVVNKDPSTITRADVTRLVDDMALLRTLANGTQVLDPSSATYKTQYLSSGMLSALDGLSRGLSAVGLVTSSISALNTALPAPTSGIDPAVAHLKAWLLPSSSTTDASGAAQSIAQSTIQAAQTAGSTAGSIQTFVEVKYVNAGVDMLEKQLNNLNQALISVQNTAQLLGTLQQVHNYIDVNAPVPLALQAYSYTGSDAKKAQYVLLVQQAIFDQMSDQDKTIIANAWGLNPSTFAPQDITPAMFNGVPLQVDGATGSSLTGSTSIITLFNAYDTSVNNARTTYNSITNPTLAQREALTTSLLNAEKTLISALSKLAYVTLPKSNLDASNVPLDPPKTPASQINALRQFISHFLSFPLDVIDDGNVLPTVPDNTPPSGLAQPYVYIMFNKAESAAPEPFFFNADHLDNNNTNVGTVLPFFDTVNASVQALKANVAVLFNSFAPPPPSILYTSTDQTTLRDFSTMGLRALLEFNSTNVNLGTSYTTHLTPAQIDTIFNDPNNGFNTILNAYTHSLTEPITYLNPVSQQYEQRLPTDAEKTVALINLENNLKARISILANEGILSTDQMIALQSAVKSYISIDNLIPDNVLGIIVDMQIGADQFLGVAKGSLSYMSLLYSSSQNPYASYVAAFHDSVLSAIDTFKQSYASRSPGYLVAVNACKNALQTAKDLILNAANTAPGVANMNIFLLQTAGSTFDQYITNDFNSLNTSVYAPPPPFQTYEAIGAAINIFMRQSYTNTASGLGIFGLLMDRSNITLPSDSQYISPNALTQLGVNTTPDFNLQSAIVQAYNNLTNAQRKAFTDTLDTYKDAAAIAMLKGPNNLYPNLTYPITPAAVTSGAYAPIPAQKFKTYYLTLNPAGTGPLLTIASMNTTNLTPAKFDELAKQMYSMTIPPFVSLPNGQTIDDVLDKIQNVRAQLTQQLAGLQIAQDQQQTASGNAASVTPIVQYVTAVLKDLQSIPDPTSSNYSLSSARTALTSWILDGLQLNANDPNAAIASAAVNSGSIQTNLQTAITASTNLNGTQQQKFQQYMTVYSEFMQSASAILTAIMQILRSMISGIK